MLVKIRWVNFDNEPQRSKQCGAVQSSQLSWTGQYKKCVQYDFKFTPVCLQWSILLGNKSPQTIVKLFFRGFGEFISTQEFVLFWKYGTVHGSVFVVVSCMYRMSSSKTSRSKILIDSDTLENWIVQNSSWGSIFSLLLSNFEST